MHMYVRGDLVIARTIVQHQDKPLKLSEKQQGEFNWMCSTEDYFIVDLLEKYTVAGATIYRMLNFKTMLLRHFHCVLSNSKSR